MKKKIQNKKGFSLVELIVVIGIFLLMTTVAMFDYNDYFAKIETDDLAEDIALTLRQAQVYGISASAQNIGSTEFNDTGYASEFFDTDNGTVADITQDRSIRGVSFYFDDKKIILFTDVNRNHIYDTGDRMIDERFITYKNIGFASFNLCNNNTCVQKTGGRVDVTFERPYPDATIVYMGNISSPSGQQYNSFNLSIGSSSYQHTKSVGINAIGNIVVN